MDITMKNTLVNEFTFKSSFKVQNGIMTDTTSAADDRANGAKHSKARRAKRADFGGSENPEGQSAAT